MHIDIYCKNRLQSQSIYQFFLFRVLHTMCCHLRAHAFARSVTVTRSSAVQASSSSRQQRRWAIVCSSPQLQFKDWVSSMYLHLLIVLLTRPTPVRRRFRERQQSHAWSDPAGRDSAASNPILLEAGISAILLFHICILVILGDESSGVTVCMKLFRDFSRLAAGIWLNSWCLVSVVSRDRSMRLATVLLI